MKNAQAYYNAGFVVVNFEVVGFIGLIWPQPVISF
jgi:hypothetical protein